jgi:hypothetical protein
MELDRTINRVRWRDVQAISKLISKEQFAVLAKYRARRDYVIGFESTEITGMSVGTSEAYFVMLKLGLAFTAAELLARVTLQKNSLGIKSLEFTKALNAGKFDRLLGGVDADNLRRYPNSRSSNVSKWRSATETTDLTPLISQLRNYMFHGAFSPSESGLAASVALRRLILELAYTTIECSDKALAKWLVKTRANSRK